MNSNLKQRLDADPMGRFQCLAIGICIILNMIDGFDVLVMAFTAASVSAEWSLNGAQVGLLLSAGLFGMAAGSLFIAPWADRLGRRPLILLCLALSGIGMLLSSLSQSPLQLATLRGLTGLGIGGILASSNVIASEYASKRWRGWRSACSPPAMRWARPWAVCWQYGCWGTGAGARCSCSAASSPSGDSAGAVVVAGVIGLPAGTPASQCHGAGQPRRRASASRHWCNCQQWRQGSRAQPAVSSSC